MNKKNTIYLIAVLILIGHFTVAQSVRRSVISSMGASQTVGETLIRSTVGQAPNVGTIFSADNYLRQGFQQPSSCVSAPKAAFAINLEGQEVCGGPYQFIYLDDPRDETTFDWQFDLGAMPDSSMLQNPNGITYISDGLKNIELTVTTGDCVNSASLDLNIQHTMLRASLTKMDLLCLEDADGSISLFIEGGTAPYQVQWSSGETDPTLLDLFPGTYEYSITDVNNCMTEGSEEITGPTDSLQIEVAVIDESCYGNADGTIEVIANGGTSPYQYNWPNGATTASLEQLTSGNYLLSLTDDNNCIKIVPISVEVACEALEIYEVITPNGDGQNDFWIIEGIQDFPTNELVIYNRWGEVVFETQSYDNSWAGIDKSGNTLPFGAYYYILKLNDASGKTLTGSVTVLRN